MIRLNVKKDNKIEVKSFISFRSLVMYLKELDLYGVVKYKNLFSSKSQVLLGLPLEYQVADKLWNLNVGTAFIHSGYKFAMAGKSRAGMVMFGGK